jgi:ureidoglycolate lyase
LNAPELPAAIDAEPLQREAYRPYGDVVAAAPGLASFSANNGTARRFDRLGAIENLRPGRATPNLCLFRAAPSAQRPFVVRMLERHAHSTQLFVPMAGARYLVIVCAGSESPDLRTLRAFIADGTQGITYRPGTWHHPLVALDRQTDFACLVHEDGSAGDAEERAVTPAVRVRC